MQSQNTKSRLRPTARARGREVSNVGEARGEPSLSLQGDPKVSGKAVARLNSHTSQLGWIYRFSDGRFDVLWAKDANDGVVAQGLNFSMMPRGADFSVAEVTSFVETLATRLDQISEVRRVAV